MSAREFEAFLARIYTDSSARASFKADPYGEALRAGLSKEECAVLEDMDWAGLELAARSYAHKRSARAGRNKARSLRFKLWNFLATLSKSIRFLS